MNDSTYFYLHLSKKQTPLPVPVPVNPLGASIKGKVEMNYVNSYWFKQNKEKLLICLEETDNN